MIHGAPDNTCITLAANTVYPNFAVYNSITLLGQGQESSIITGMGYSSEVVLNNGAEVTYQDLTLANSPRGWMAIINGTLTLRRCSIRDSGQGDVSETRGRYRTLPF
jgi:hypothetical protein